MDPADHVTFSVTHSEVTVIPNSQDAFLRLTYLENPPQPIPSERRYVFSHSQLVELKTRIEAALQVLEDVMKRDPPIPHLH
ncbi:MAG TPA: hypothetical protein VFP00_06885 [Burkholderiales bacterium]|nr:hypothetical protein [Burkholderiales bacterium]